MNERVVLVAIKYLVITVALLHTVTSLGATPSVRVLYRQNNVDNKNVLECFDSDNRIQSGATFTFSMKPDETREVVAEGVTYYPFTIQPSNESLVTCTLNSQESAPVKVAAIPQYTAGVTDIRQYNYSDTAIVDVECPFQLGRLKELYKFSWGAVRGGFLPISVNGTQGLYWLAEENNRTLHVNISAGSQRNFQCVGELQTCSDSTSSCITEGRNSPTITIINITRPRIMEPPDDVTVDQGEPASFTCTAAGSGDLTIEWGCSDGSNCGQSSQSEDRGDGNVTSTYTITDASANLTVTCVVNQSLAHFMSGESHIEVRLPPPTEVLRTTAELIVIPAPTTTSPPTIDPPGSTTDDPPPEVSEGVIISVGVVGIIVVVVFLMNMVIIGGIKFRKYSINIRFQLTKKQKDKELESDEIHYRCSSSTDNTQHVVIKGSLRNKLPPSLNIKSANLRVLNPIGQGEFGIVYKGYLVGQYIDEVVAIKTLKGFIDNDAIHELLSECVKMKNLNHLHVMTLKGVCLDGGPMPYIILPYMANGSLLSYLKKERSILTVSVAEGESSEEEESKVLIIKKRLLDMCLQVAKGMDYLASEKIVHRDLAARNCMIDMSMTIKVADFGLSVNTGTKDYYRLTGDMGTKLPIKWMAPESLSDYVFSEKSDVWSYGVTCWEIFTGGLIPYVGTKPSSLLTLLQQGDRLEISNNSACSTEMYSMMMWCWEMEPGNRPSFTALVQTLSKSLEKMAGYLPLGAIAGLNEENAHYVHVGAIARSDHEASTGQAEQCHAV